MCPWKLLIGLSLCRRQTWMHWSVEHDANDEFVCQSTSSAGAEWKENCCVHKPDEASHIIVVLSTWKQESFYLWCNIILLMWSDLRLYNPQNLTWDLARIHVPIPPPRCLTLSVSKVMIDPSTFGFDLFRYFLHLLWRTYVISEVSS